MVVIILIRTSEENQGLAHLEKRKGKPPVVDLVVDWSPFRLAQLNDFFILYSYSGYTPRVKYAYGETFGNTTGRWFQDYRAATLNTSKERMGRGGDRFLPFPTYYTNNPDHVLGARTSSRDRWLAAPKYKLLNLDDRDGSIKKYDKVCFLLPEAFLRQKNSQS